MTNDRALILVKIVHTVVWACFVACIVAIPIAAHRHAFGVAAALIGVVAVEGLVLVLNRWTCPLTDVASRYTEQRHANFDIYLPHWLAQHNKTIFTPIYLLGAAYTAYVWWWQHG